MSPMLSRQTDRQKVADMTDEEAIDLIKFDSDVLLYYLHYVVVWFCCCFCGCQSKSTDIRSFLYSGPTSQF